ncbi:hypothetical protein BU15DRAFT_67215 [Melanogaster broomeanus]|nr:hypothetical protein BU15DRAFT_67215 [Melanogaster broomeanus]
MDSLQPFFDVVQVSVSFLFIFDYLYQLDDEASLAPLHRISHLTKTQLTFIWGRRDWSIGKAVCVATRYIPFVLIPVTLSSTHTCRVLFGYLWLISLERISKGALGHPDADTCHSLFYAIMIAIVLSGVALLLRIYAMWNKSRLILTVICCTLAASVGPLVVLFILFAPSVTFGVPPLPIVSGCYMTNANSDLSVCFIFLMCAEAVNTSLMLYRAYRHFRHAPNVLIQSLTRGGVFYCVVMFAMSVTNVLVVYLLPVQYSEVLLVYQGVMHTIVATRMQLHLRKLDWSIHLVDPSLVGSVLPMECFKLVLDLSVVDGERMGRVVGVPILLACGSLTFQPGLVGHLGTKFEAHLPEPTVLARR